MSCMVGNHEHHKRKRFETGLEICSRYHVHSACAADLVAADDSAYAGNATRLAGSDLLPAGAHRSWRQAFLNLEVQDHEGECRDTNSRTLLPSIDADRSFH